MNNNDKIHDNALSDNDLDMVSGGTGDVIRVCPKCGEAVTTVHPPENRTRPEPKRRCVFCDYKEW